MTTGAEFADRVRAVLVVARRQQLQVPAFRSPPKTPGVDRSIRRRGNGDAVVAVRIADRPLNAVTGDVIEGVAAVNRLDDAAKVRFVAECAEALGGF